MVLTVDVKDAAARLGELLAEVEAGHEIVLARGQEPVARLTRAIPAAGKPTIAAEIRAGRRAFGQISVDDILAWRDEDRR